MGTGVNPATSHGRCAQERSFAAERGNSSVRPGSYRDQDFAVKVAELLLTGLFSERMLALLIWKSILGSGDDNVASGLTSGNKPFGLYRLPKRKKGNLSDCNGSDCGVRGFERVGASHFTNHRGTIPPQFLRL
jgi:hypothetical protein